CPLAAYAQLALVNEEPAGTRAREDCKETLLLTLGRRGGAPHQAANGGLSSGCKPHKLPLNQPGRAGIRSTSLQGWHPISGQLLADTQRQHTLMFVADAGQLRLPVATLGDGLSR